MGERRIIVLACVGMALIAALALVAYLALLLRVSSPDVAHGLIALATVLLVAIIVVQSAVLWQVSRHRRPRGRDQA